MATKVEKRPIWLAPELRGAACGVAALLLLLSFISFREGGRGDNWLGLVGHAAGWSLRSSFGLGTVLVIGYLAHWSWRLIAKRMPTRPRLELSAFALLLVSTCLLFSVIAVSSPTIGNFFARIVPTDAVAFHEKGLIEIRHYLGGIPAYALYTDLPLLNLHHLLSPVGVSLIFSGTALASLLVITETNPLQVARDLWKRYRERPKPEPKPKIKAKKTEILLHQEVKTAPPPPPTPAKARPATKPPKKFQAYAVPMAGLLADAKPVDLADLKRSLKEQAKVLEETLKNFNIDATVGEINCGPTITSFEVIPAVGVKVQSIKALENDIALNLQARSIRIIAPIPGKAAVGIEVPNPKPQGVAFKEMLASYKAQGANLNLPLLLGKAVNGEAVITDLAKMPHLIIAGATGSGKSVCVNSIIMSILLNLRPDEVRLLMIDPKKVELTPYSDLPHMLAPVITEPHEACMALNWLVKEMEKRYEICRQVSVRNLEAFNSRERDVAFEESLDIEIPERLPFIVGIIDELADLMMASSSDIETPITRIAQMARAVGIHLILATQRPSREVITGIIKANFPTRIAFKVANRINSQIILDETGAETLLGNGDMLLLPPGTSHLIRAQGTYVSDKEIQKVIAHIGRQAPPCYEIQSFNRQPDLADDNPRDALYAEALQTVLDAGVASTTYLQRKLKVGYARAASIMDQLEDNGVIGPQEGAKPRKVLKR